jgi:hypothetical protein
MKALVDIRTARGFANGMKFPLAQFRFQEMNRFEMRSAFAEPFRQTGLGSDLDK